MEVVGVVRGPSVMGGKRIGCVLFFGCAAVPFLSASIVARFWLGLREPCLRCSLSAEGSFAGNPDRLLVELLLWRLLASKVKLDFLFSM